MLHLGRDARGLAEGQRQGERDGAAQPAPEDHELVASAHRAAAPGSGDEGQHAVEGRGPRAQGADDEGGDAHEIERGDVLERLGDQHRGQHEDERAAPEAELAPDRRHAGPFVGREARPADTAEDETSDDDGYDAGDAEVGIRDGVGEVGHAPR